MTAQTRKLLEEERASFRATLPADIGSRWAASRRRIAAVLSGGGARGAYEAGVLLVFQDASVPTHILAATSVGSINAASYAAHSATLVGDATHMVESWSEVTPPAVGIDWSRYIFVLAGLIAATAGIGNLVVSALRDASFVVHPRHPKLTWAMLAAAGIAVLLLYDKVTYLGYVATNVFRRISRWKPDRRKVMQSVLANLVVWTFVVLVFVFAHVHLLGRTFLLSARSKLLAGAMAAALLALGAVLRQIVSSASHKFLRLPLRSGLFPNYERTRFLRERLHIEGLKTSPIRVVMTATEMESGADRYFTNASREQLLADGADLSFVENEIEPVADLLQAVIASSAFPIAYEVVPMSHHRWTDGGIVANQPIRPALRLGADVIFLILVEPREQKAVEVRTFLDVGVRAIDILMSQNLKTDTKNLLAINQTCEKHAAELGVRPEQVIIDMGMRTYRYVKSITVRPSEPLAATVLDFEGRITGPAIAQGYRDGSNAVRELLQYLAEAPVGGPQYVLRFKAERAAGAV